MLRLNNDTVYSVSESCHIAGNTSLVHYEPVTFLPDVTCYLSREGKESTTHVEQLCVVIQETQGLY